MSEYPKKGAPVSDELIERLRELSTENPGLQPYAHHVGSAVIRPQDTNKATSRAIASMNKQTEAGMMQLYQQMDVLLRQAEQIKKRVEFSERIYKSKLTFEPLIGETYYLYQRKDKSDVLSIISPAEWGIRIKFEFVAKLELLPDHTWEVKEWAVEPNKEAK